MRDDMTKVVSERSRNGHAARYHDVRDRFRFDIRKDPKGEDVPAMQESMRHRHIMKRVEKGSSLHRAPLYRFLLSRVGLPWAEIWSEICAMHRADSKIKAKVRNHLNDFVLGCTRRLDDGRIAGTSGQQRRRWHGDLEIPGESSYHTQFCVCPDTGLLLLTDDLPQVREARLERERQREAERVKAEANRKAVSIDADTELVRLDGVWFVVTYADLPRDKELHFYAVALPTDPRIQNRQEGFVYKETALGTWRIYDWRYPDRFDVLSGRDVRYGDAYGRRSRLWYSTPEDEDRPVWAMSLNGKVRTRYAKAKKQADRRTLERFGVVNEANDNDQAGIGRFIRRARCKERKGKRS